MDKKTKATVKLKSKIFDLTPINQINQMLPGFISDLMIRKCLSDEDLLILFRVRSLHHLIKTLISDAETMNLLLEDESNLAKFISGVFSEEIYINTSLLEDKVH